jgi:hypothetical protein
LVGEAQQVGHLCNRIAVLGRGGVRPAEDTSLDRLDDQVGEAEWSHCSGNAADLRDLLKATDLDEVANIVGQIGDQLKVKSMGNIGLGVHRDLFELLEAHHVLQGVDFK